MTELDIASREWFHLRRQELKRDFRALEDFEAAIQVVDEYYQLWGRGSATLMEALHNAMIIRYGRVFTDHGNKKNHLKFPAPHLQKADGFDLDLHKHLMRLRDKVIAHSDANELKCNVTLQRASYFEVAFPVALNVYVASLIGTNDKSTIVRYRSHFLACKTYLVGLVDTAMTDILDAAWKAPLNFGEATFKRNENVDLTKPHEVTLPQFLGPQPKITPSLSVGENGYVYRRYTRTKRPSGRFVLQTPAGEIDLNMDPDREPKAARD